LTALLLRLGGRTGIEDAIPAVSQRKDNIMNSKAEKSRLACANEHNHDTAGNPSLRCPQCGEDYPPL
jgi:hypothetical protein